MCSRRSAQIIELIQQFIPHDVEGVHRCPGLLGGMEWHGPAYDPASDTLFVALNEARPDRCATAAFKEFVSVTSACTPTTVTPVSPAISSANESGLIEDIDQWLEHLAPFRKDYKHHNTGEDNGDSHLKSAAGPS